MKFKIVYADELYKVQKEMNALLIDIRTREEYDRSHWKLDASQSVIFYCTHGGSSMKLARYLGNRGFDTATVIGGYNAMCGYQKKLQKYG